MEVDSQRNVEESGAMGKSQDEKLGKGASAPGIREAVQALEPVVYADATTCCVDLGKFPLLCLSLLICKHKYPSHSDMMRGNWVDICKVPE